MFTTQEILALFPTHNSVFLAARNDLRKAFAGYLKTSTATKADYEAAWEKINSGNWADKAEETQLEYLTSLLNNSPEEIAESFESRGYAAKHRTNLATKLGNMGYAHKKELAQVLKPFHQEAKENGARSLEARLNAQWEEQAADEFVLAVYQHAKKVLAKPKTANEWDLALAIQLVTGRRFAEIAKMKLQDGMFLGKAKGKNGQYDGVWFPLFQFCDVTKALEIVQAKCGPCETAGQVVKWSESVNARLAHWPQAPGEITGKYFRKVYAEVAKKLPQQFPMPANWGSMAPVARASWLLGHSEGDFATQNSYAIFDCSKTRALSILKLFS
jgi:hypothetical protein